MHLKLFVVNNRNGLPPNLWGLCLESIDPVILAAAYQHVSFSLTWNNTVLFISAVYASTSHINRRILWSELACLQQNNPGAWCFLGDFNAILGATEKRGGNIPLAASCDEFRAWTDSCSLTHIDTRGSKYTWSNGRGTSFHIELRLDRSICNNDRMYFWDSMACCTLPRSQSDHHPLLLCLNKGLEQYPSSFKFFNMWLDHKDCRRVVEEVWARPVSDVRFGLT